MTSQYMTEIEKEDIRFTKRLNLFVLGALSVMALTSVTVLVFLMAALFKLWF